MGCVVCKREDATYAALESNPIVPTDATRTNATATPGESPKEHSQRSNSISPTIHVNASGDPTNDSKQSHGPSKISGEKESATSAKLPTHTGEESSAAGIVTPQPPLSGPSLLPVADNNVDSAGLTGKLNVERNGIQRNLSTCRLKKAIDIADVYDISAQVLGTGISGAVRVANHKMTGRKYAIKTLSLEGVSPKKAAMLHNEVSIYLQLDHPNIAKLIEVYETDKAIHLVMELCTGGELYDRLAAKKKYSESHAAKVAQQMLSAINYCHQHRICHRDLKLENWVYADNSPDAPLKLIDFGFSRIFNPGVPMTAMHGTVYYVSPEVMDGCYQEKCDIWSIGVIVYMLLSGSPPFNGSYDHEILIKIKRGVFSFSGPRWEGISDGAKTFIAFLLRKDPDERPSAEEALKHSWLQRRGAIDHDIDLSVVKSMRDFALGNIMRRAALGVVALGMTSQEVDELEAVFRALDRSNRGTIQLQDLANVLIEKLHIDDSEAKRIFERIDQTGKQEVHYSEFIASTLQAKFIKDDNLIKEAFQRFDIENKQIITLDNLRGVLGDSYNGSRIEDILALCDTNKDGVIDYEEFTKALTSDEAALFESRNCNITPSPSKQNVPGDSVSDQANTTSVPSRPLPEKKVYPSSEQLSQTSVTHASRETALTALHSMRKATCLSTTTADHLDRTDRQSAVA